MKFGVIFSYYDETEQDDFEEDFDIEANTKEEACMKIYDEMGNYDEILNMEVECVELGEIFYWDDVCEIVSKCDSN